MPADITARRSGSQSPSKENSNPQLEQRGSKRKCVPSACVPCRKRKSKCDGTFPHCSTCQAVYRTDCYYDPDSEPRRKAAIKSESKDSLTLGTDRGRPADVLIASIKTLPESELPDLIQQIRTESSIEAIADSLVHSVEVPRSADRSSSFEESFGELVQKTPTVTSGGSRQYGHTSSLGFVESEVNVVRQPKPAMVNVVRSGTWTSITANEEFVDHLFQLYFRWSHAFYYLFPVECFTYDFEHGKTKYCSALLVNAILALGCQYSDRSEARADPNDARTKGDHFFQEARQLLFDDESPSLTTVQALAIMSMREASVGNDSRGYQYIGRCLHMATELGLHLSFTGQSQLCEIETEARRVTFWGCFACDQVWSICVGRISPLPRAAIDLDKPTNPDKTKGGNPIYAQMIARRTYAFPGEDNNRRAQFLRQISMLAEHINDMTVVFYAPKERFTSRKVLDCYSKLQMWYSSLPEPFLLPKTPAKHVSPHVPQLHMLYWTCILHLFRPLLKIDLIKSDVNPKDTCRNAANKISEIWRYYVSKHGAENCNIVMTHIIMTSTIMHLINLPSSCEAKQNLIEGMRDLDKMSKTHTFATRSLKILFGFAAQWGMDMPPEVPRNVSPIPMNHVIQTAISSDRRIGSTTQTHPSIGIYRMASGTSESDTSNATQVASTTSPISSNNIYNVVPTSSPPQSTGAQSYLHVGTITAYPQYSDLLQTNPGAWFFSPFPGQGLPMMGNTINSNPMDLSTMLGGVDEFEQFQKDGFRVNQDYYNPLLLGASAAEQQGALGQGQAHPMGYGEGWFQSGTT